MDPPSRRSERPPPTSISSDRSDHDRGHHPGPGVLPARGRYRGRREMRDERRGPGGTRPRSSSRSTREYRDVVPMFKFVVETERRFYLANKVELNAPPTPMARPTSRSSWKTPGSGTCTARLGSSRTSGVMTFATSTSSSSSQGSVSRRPHRASERSVRPESCSPLTSSPGAAPPSWGGTERVGRSELDLLVRMGNVTVVVEVKTVSRTAGGISAAAHLTAQAQAARAMAGELGAPV